MEKAKTRPPIITVLGHVDHGKTTLLDALRKSNVAAGEAGGITQSIGASSVTTKEGKKITFIDTPGHAAFAKMRGRGAQVADIVLLVVGADDGVKPQTKEALALITEAKIPFIVVATKMDLPSAEVETVYSQLEKEGVLFESRGGDTPLVPVSAKKNEGIEKLLETILLVSEINEIKSAPNEMLDAVIIETSKGKGGPQASAIIRSGKLKVGEVIYAGTASCKIKALFSAKGGSASGGNSQLKSVKEVPPGEAALILGFGEVPPVGTKITSFQGNETGGGQVKEKTAKLGEGEIAVFLKAENAGALEALVASMPSKVLVLSATVGDLSSSDVLAAKGSNAPIFVFESKVSSDVRKLAETEDVRVERFEIIYELIARIEEILQKGLVVVTGKAEILAAFPFNDQKIAGCKILEGKIGKGETLTLIRGEKEVGKAKVISMKKQKQEITAAGGGEEFGVILSPQLDFKIGDMLLSAANG